MVFTSPIKFQDRIFLSHFWKFGAKKHVRAGVAYKRALTDYLFEDSWGLYLDLDEYLFLPPGVEKIQDFLSEVNGKTLSVPASVVEFFPENLRTLRQDCRPQTIESLIEHAPFFEAKPLLAARIGRHPMKVGLSKTAELSVAFLDETHVSYTHKTPLVFHSRANFREGAHKTSIPPSSHHLLTIAHFVYTSNSLKKIEDAIKTESHHGQKYSVMMDILKRMEAKRGSFLGDSSQRFTSTSQFVDCGLMNPS
jgi:hypothetical protein